MYKISFQKGLVPFIALFAEKGKKQKISNNVYYDKQKKMTMILDKDDKPISLIHSFTNYEFKIKTQAPIESEKIDNNYFNFEEKIKTAVARESNAKYNYFEIELITEVAREKDNFRLPDTIRIAP